MTTKKTLRTRENELRVLLASPAGQQELQQLDVSLSRSEWQAQTATASAITYILVHEREQGLISA